MDEFVILGCDGVWDVLSNQQAANFIRNEFENGANEENAAKALAEHAFSIGSTDNISVLVIKFHWAKQSENENDKLDNSLYTYEHQQQQPEKLNSPESKSFLGSDEQQRKQSKSQEKISTITQHSHSISQSSHIESKTDLSTHQISQTVSVSHPSNSSNNTNNLMSIAVSTPSLVPLTPSLTVAPTPSQVVGTPKAVVPEMNLNPTQKISGGPKEISLQEQSDLESDDKSPLSTTLSSPSFIPEPSFSSINPSVHSTLSSSSSSSSSASSYQFSFEVSELSSNTATSKTSLLPSTSMSNLSNADLGQPLIAEPSSLSYNNNNSSPILLLSSLSQTSDSQSSETVSLTQTVDN